MFYFWTEMCKRLKKRILGSCVVFSGPSNLSNRGEREREREGLGRNAGPCLPACALFPPCPTQPPPPLPSLPFSAIFPSSSHFLPPLLPPFPFYPLSLPFIPPLSLSSTMF